MNFSKIMLATTAGFIGGLMLVEYCPKFKQFLDKGKKVLSKSDD